MEGENNETRITYLESLRSAWGSYIKLIDILIGVSGATALLFFNSFKAEEWAAYAHIRWTGIAVASATSAMIFAIFWRAAAQHFLEYETLGISDWAEKYFVKGGLGWMVTKAHEQQKLRGFYRVTLKVLPWTTSGLILLSWFSIYCVMFGRPF